MRADEEEEEEEEECEGAATIKAPNVVPCPARFVPSTLGAATEVGR